jgi:hypothetical protein
MVDENEFEEMAKRVVDTNGMFTGAEAGKSFHRKLTTKQLDALIDHKWPKPKTSEEMADSLESVINNIKEGDTNEKTNKRASKMSRVIDHGLQSSRVARLDKLIRIGKKLRTEGWFFVQAQKNNFLWLQALDCCTLSISWLIRMVWIVSRGHVPNEMQDCCFDPWFYPRFVAGLLPIPAQTWGSQPTITGKNTIGPDKIAGADAVNANAVEGEQQKQDTKTEAGKLESQEKNGWPQNQELEEDEEAVVIRRVGFVFLAYNVEYW